MKDDELLEKIVKHKHNIKHFIDFVESNNKEHTFFILRAYYSGEDQHYAGTLFFIPEPEEEK